MEEKKVEDVIKPEEPKQEVETKSDKPAATEEKNSDESKDTTPPPPPQEIVLKVYMHCEGCAKKVRRCLKGFEGVDYVFTDCKNQKVVVKGEKADPVKVFERIQKKSHRKVELLSPIPAAAPPPLVEEPKMVEEKETSKPEEKKEEVIKVVLKVNMHCEACAQEIKKRILRMKGVENVEPDLGNSQVTVKGIFVPEKLLHYVYKRTGKQAVILKNEPEKKEEEKAKEEKKAEGKEEKKGGDDAAKEKKDGGEEAPAPVGGEDGGGDAVKVVEMKKNEFYYYNPQIHQIYTQSQRYPNEGYVYQNYPSQMFSDENPNACTVM
ncbi:heavy metal-associated isoprenylated plant protein 7-like [Impatiens glandulifera]|uniref:heavy metal-associated isoprenylated plant protein 7-like n=1 Tax=Impatiens glandulifera TaxID=253017 RepID=UPI001FB0C013|nr:heavy metal-associated isoprenylated plant protein 7-like [Impatiens glandulifera]